MLRFVQENKTEIQKGQIWQHYVTMKQRRLVRRKLEPNILFVTKDNNLDLLSSTIG